MDKSKPFAPHKSDQNNKTQVTADEECKQKGFIRTLLAGILWGIIIGIIGYFVGWVLGKIGEGLVPLGLTIVGFGSAITWVLGLVFLLVLIIILVIFTFGYPYILGSIIGTKVDKQAVKEKCWNRKAIKTISTISGIASYTTFTLVSITLTGHIQHTFRMISNFLSDNQNTAWWFYPLIVIDAFLLIASSRFNSYLPISKVLNTKSEKRDYVFRVECSRCGEIIEGRIDLENDLTPNYEEDEGSHTTYFVRKVLIGNNRCFQPIEVEMKLGKGHWLIEKKIHGGEFVE